VGEEGVDRTLSRSFGVDSLDIHSAPKSTPLRLL